MTDAAREKGVDAGLLARMAGDTPEEIAANADALLAWARQSQFDYQSECHCSKTRLCAVPWGRAFDYQSECHCSKTAAEGHEGPEQFDYQSECHCSKTL